MEILKYCILLNLKESFKDLFACAVRYILRKYFLFIAGKDIILI